MERGWDATDLLAPLWGRVGGRDALAALTGIQPGTLSGYNTGRLRIGRANAEKIAAVLKVSVLELGAPEEQADRRGRTLLVRHQELEEEVTRLATEVRRLARRVVALERRFLPATATSSRRAK